MIRSDQKVVLVAALDWGLGHASRSIPVVAELRKQGAEVILAGSGPSGLLLRKSYPQLTYVACPPYRIHYRGSSMYWSMFRQLPKIGVAVFREYFWLRKIIRDYHIQAVISDSRFGCFHPRVPSVILTHQLQLQLQPRWLSLLVNRIYQGWLRQFDEVWIPDLPNGLSGRLSHPSPFQHSRFVGYLSRFSPGGQMYQWDLLILLSGPEPQRSQLESIVRSQLDQLAGLRVLLVQGKPEKEGREVIREKQEVYSYLTGSALEAAIASSAIVLCRSGYSSLMDLARMRKRAILIPTPGQPEQEYLARRCREKSWATVVRDQHDLKLAAAVAAAKRQVLTGFPPETQSDLLAKAIHQLLSSTSGN